MVYQFIAFRWFYPGEALIVAIILALFPYPGSGSFFAGLAGGQKL